MKKKSIPTPIIIELIILVIIIGLIIGVTVRNANHKNTAQTEPQSEAVAETGTETETDNKNSTSSASAGEAEPTSSPTSDAAGIFYYYSNYNEPQDSYESSGPSIISFPYRDDTSGIVIGYMDSYDGSFLEDSSDEDVSGVAVIVVQNQSSSDIELAQITLTQGDTNYNFEVSALKQGAIAVLQELDRKACPDGDINSCNVVATNPEALPMSSDSVSVEETEDGALNVTNLTADTIPCVRVFYKYYSEEDGVYVGGITYTVKLTDLEAGQSLVVTPSHYVAGYSRVVMVRTYDTDEG